MFLFFGPDEWMKIEVQNKNIYKNWNISLVIDGSNNNNNKNDSKNK